MTRTELEHIIRAAAAITIAVAKHVAGREKDIRYIADLWDEDLIDPKTMEQRLKQTPMSDEVRRRVEKRMRQDRARYEYGRTRA